MKPHRVFWPIAAVVLAVCCADPVLGAAAPAPPAPNAAPAGAPELVDGYFKLGFDRLGTFPFTPPGYDPAARPGSPQATGNGQIPAAIRKFNGRKAIVTGFMLPVKMDNGLAVEFLLVQNQMMCCYGLTPQMNQWVVVKMVKGGVKPVMDVPVSFYGTLHVGAIFDNGYMTGIYSLDGEKMGAIGG